MDESDPGGEPQTSTAVMPSVVAVLVTHDPGPWLETVLDSLVKQDYRNLSILVVDVASAEDLTPRIASVAPGAYVRRLATTRGYGAAANRALQMVQGAAFYLHCHDDVALDPSAVRIMVEEAYRSNAGIVGPKLVSWTDPQRLLQVGLGVDQFGVPAAMAERGELDQEQHDAVRDVFAVPGGCTLVRSDLFAALGGYDEAMTFHGEDVDLCWRAHLAGARVLVAPNARVRHLEALGERRSDDRRRLQARHRLRMVLTNYGAFYTMAVLLKQLLLTLVEAPLAFVTGRFRHAGDLVGAYGWNATRVGSILAKRRRVRRLRQVRDLEIRRLQVRGSARLTAFVRGQLSARGASTSLADGGRNVVSAVRSGMGQQNLVIVLILVAVVAFGSRHLLTQRLPVLGELMPFPGSSLTLLREWWSGWRPVGLGVAAGSPTGLALVGVATTFSFGLIEAVRSLLVVGLLPLGALGAWRLARITDRSRAQVLCLLAYLINPLPYNALAAGSWRGMAAYAVSPWLLRRLALVSGAEPFGATAGSISSAPAGHAHEHVAGDLDEHVAAPVAAAPVTAGKGTARATIKQIASFGLIVGLGSAIYPALPLLVLVIVVGLLFGSLLVVRWGGMDRVLLIGVSGAVVGALLNLPWLLASVGRDDPDLTFAGRAAEAAGYRVVDALHFDVGPLGASPLVWGLFVAALLPLAIGRGWRLVWAARAWGVAVACWALVALERADVVSFRLPPPEVLLAPAAAGLAFAVGLGALAFELDLRGYRFGWRQATLVVATAGLALATLPFVAASFDGRWDMPRGGYDRTSRLQAAGGEDGGAFRILWLGDAAVLPVASWPLPASVAAGAYATTEGLPGTRNVWTGPETDDTRLVPDALAVARAGDTSRLGRLLAPMGIRYVVVSDQLAPAPFGGLARPADPVLGSLLSGQLDLEEVNVNPAMRVFRNVAWIPEATGLGSQSEVEDPVALDASQVGPPLPAAGVNRYDGDLPTPAAVHLANSYSSQWTLTVDGAEAASAPGFGWAQRFTPDRAGQASVGYDVPGGRMAMALLQIALWLIVAVLAARSEHPSPERRWWGRGARREPALDAGETGAAVTGPVLVTGPIEVPQPLGTDPFGPDPLGSDPLGSDPLGPDPFVPGPSDSGPGPEGRDRGTDDTDSASATDGRDGSSAGVER